MKHCDCGCIYEQSVCPHCESLKITQIKVEYGVEYYPNDDEGEQFEYLTERGFLDLIASHKARELDPVIEYEKFTIFDNGRDGRRLTIRDVYGIFYS